MALNIMGGVLGGLSGLMGGGSSIGDIIGGLNRRTDEAMKLQDAQAESQLKLAKNSAKNDGIKMVANAIKDAAAGTKEASDAVGRQTAKA